MARKGGDRMEQDREFYITWCSLLSGYAESYYAAMSDSVLEGKYMELLKDMEQEIENGRG